MLEIHHFVALPRAPGVTVMDVGTLGRLESPILCGTVMEVEPDSSVAFPNDSVAYPTLPRMIGG